MLWWEYCLRLLMAVTVGSAIGIERERKSRPAGMRTHILVCVGAALVAIMERLMLTDIYALNVMQGDAGLGVSLGRLSAQVISGIGFLGAGTILISQKKIAGLTTAASLWSVACLGLAVGMGYYLLAGTGCLLVIVTLSLLRRVSKTDSVKHVEVTFIHRAETLEFINEYFHALGITIVDIDFHVENKEGKNLYTNIYTLDMNHQSYMDIVTKLSEHRNIQGVRTSNIYP